MDLPEDRSGFTHARAAALIKSFLSHQPGPSVHTQSFTLGHNAGDAKLCLSTSATLPIGDPILSVCLKEMLTVNSSLLKSSTEGRNDCLFKFLALVKHDYFHSGSVF